MTMRFEKLYIFFQSQVVLFYKSRMRMSNITKMPWFMGDACYLFLSLLIAFNKAKVCCLGAELLTDSAIRKVRAEKGNLFALLGHIYRQSGLMLAAAGEGDIVPREFFAVFTHRGVKYMLLLL